MSFHERKGDHGSESVEVAERSEQESCDPSQYVGHDAVDFIFSTAEVEARNTIELMDAAARDARLSALRE